MSDVPTLYKYMPFRKEFFDNFYLRCTPRSALNDPFEMLPSESYCRSEMEGRGITDKEQAQSTTNGYKSYIAAHGVVSFSQASEPSNPLMWAHYASDHAGISVELDKSIIDQAWHPPKTGNPYGDLFAENDYITREVTYSNQRLKSNPWIPNLALEDFKSIYFHKDERWNYENEYRFLTRLDKTNRVLCDKDFYGQHFKHKSFDDVKEIQSTSNGEHNAMMSFTLGNVQDPTCLYALSNPNVLCMMKVPKEAIKSITCGVNIADEDMAYVMAIGQKFDIKVYKSEIHDDEYILGRKVCKRC
jgi:hypothetical protein